MFSGLGGGQRCTCYIQIDMFQTPCMRLRALGNHLESPGWADGAEFGATDNKGWSISGWTLQ